MKKILLLGGGGVHDYKSICPVLKKYLGEGGDLAVDYADQDYDALRAERLAPYDAAVIYHTGGELALEPKRGLVEWVASGRGLVGIHGAADSFRNSPEYLAMVGGFFRAHPFYREYLVSLADNEHPVTKGIEGYVVKDWEKWPVYEYKVKDEQYLLDYDSRAQVLATTVFRGRVWPVAWSQWWGQGKVFYLALGHDLAACQNAFFQKIFVNGVRWVAEPEPPPSQKDPRFAIS